MTVKLLHIMPRSMPLPVMDRVFGFIGLAFLSLTLWDKEQAKISALFVGEAVWGIAPFLVLSVLIAAFAKASSLDRMIARAFTGNGLMLVVSASIVGAFSPFCSCGVIPLVAALLAMGVPLSAVMAFWLASPIMDPTMFVMTVGTLGWQFATFKALAAVAVGIFGGLGTAQIQKMGFFAIPLREAVAGSRCGVPDVSGNLSIIWKFWQDEQRKRDFGLSAKTNLMFLGKWLLFAFTLESLMVAYLPEGIVMSVLGGDGVWPILFASIIGIPAYLNGYAALPLVNGLINEGMQPGAGMAFLLAGGVTSIPASIAVFALARLPVFIAYISFALLGTLLLSFVFAVLNSGG